MNLTQHVITLKEGDQTPIFDNSYRIPDALRNPVENELKRMLQNGIIKYDPNTNYNSPLVIVKKSDGGIRLVHNFISLNKRTVDDRYQMPNANELLSRVAGGKFITKIDLASAFFHVELETNSQKYAGFQTPFGTFSYLRLYSLTHSLECLRD